ncbi:ATP-binding protein [Bradyrhizobium rifense]|nr:ATP-binding protein [Bradyrhizobium rifense]
MSSTDLLFAVRPLPGGRFVYEGINPALESHLGISSEDIREMDISSCMSSDDARSVCEALRACLAEGSEVRIRHPLAFGGQRQNMETTVVPVVDPAAGGVVRLIGGHRVARRDAFENAAGAMDDAHMGFSLVSIQEDIQQRIASDLHDSTCQHLIAASLGLMRIRLNLGDPVGAERLCDEIDASIDEAIREIRAFAYLLHPQNLTIDGLKATIEQYAGGFAARTSLGVATRIVSDVDRLPHETQCSLLRVIQEALTNVFRHAKATEVKIVFDATDSHFRLTISDNGRGLWADPAKQGARAISIGVGIPAMRARLEQIGGSLDISSASATLRSGTVLCAVFPHSLAANRRGRRKAPTVTRAHAGTP